MIQVEIARVEQLPIDRGVAALVGTTPVALFRLADGEIAAIDHVDPFTGVPVLARGLIGSIGDVVTVASPLHKQRFDLRTGACLDDPEVAVRVWPIDVVDGVVFASVAGPDGDLTSSEIETAPQSCRNMTAPS